MKSLHELPFDNRRRRVRVPMNANVTCILGGKMVNGLSWNISQDGIQPEAAGLKTGDSVQMLVYSSDATDRDQGRWPFGCGHTMGGRAYTLLRILNARKFFEPK